MGYEHPGISIYGGENMKQLSIHSFEEVYKDLAINIDSLGCIMLDIEPMANMKEGKQGIVGIPLYKTKNPDRKWINGWILDKKAHVTLLYGLLNDGNLWKPLVDKVLEGWSLSSIEIEKVGFFDSPYKDEPYYCIVAHVKITPELMEGHQRLSFLPHINTYAEYKAHMTIAYINKSYGEKSRDTLIKKFNDLWVGKKLVVKKGVNYGGYGK